jgi:fucose 4-O-acetylase-like acetyltransferase
MKRSKLIDMAKGAGILFVILGHISLTPSALKIWIYSFHMPLFFICSGLTFSISKYKNYGAFVKSKIRSIVIPYFFLGITLWALSLLYTIARQLCQGNSIAVNLNIGHVVLSLLLGHRLHKFYFSLWFLCVLFLSELFFYFLVKYEKQKPLYYAIIVCVSLAVQWFVFRFVQGWFLSLDLVPTGIAYLAMGKMFRLIEESKPMTFRQSWQIPIALVLSLLTCAWNYTVAGRTDLYYCRIGNPVLYGLSAMIGSWFVILVLTHFGDLRITEYFGRNSLVTYAYQNSFCIPFATLITDVASDHVRLVTGDTTLQWLMIISLTLLLSTVLIEIINRCFPWMLGRKIKRNGASPTR